MLKLPKQVTMVRSSKLESNYTLVRCGKVGKRHHVLRPNLALHDLKLPFLFSIQFTAAPSSNSFIALLITHEIW